MSLLSTTLDTQLRTVAQRLECAVGRNKRARSAIECRMNTDDFLVAASQHLSSVVEVVLPAAQRIPGSRPLARELLVATKRLERALVMLKAKQYGQAQNVGRTWEEVWGQVRDRLDAVSRIEQRVADELADALPPDDLERLTGRLEHAARRAPTRPHPNLPHQGVAGRVVRSVWGRADRLWDELEGRVSHPLSTPEAS